MKQKFKEGDTVWIGAGTKESPRHSGTVIKVFQPLELRGYNMRFYIVDCNLVADWQPFLEAERDVYATEDEKPWWR
jgi:hypothetical protein